MARDYYLVSYDVSDDKRRTRLFKTLRDFGDHVQFSVFFCELNERELVLLRGRMKELVHAPDDQVLLLNLGSAPLALDTALECLGRTYTPACRVQVV